MPRALSACFFILSLHFALQVKAQSAECPPANLWLAPTNTAYQDATSVKRLLESHGIIVKCIFETKLSSEFLLREHGIERFTLEGEACFRTNYGDFSAFFLPKPHSFSALKIEERRDGGGYLYMFSGMPKIWLLKQFGSSQRLYYFSRDNYLLSVADGPLRSSVQEALHTPPVSF